MNLVEYLRPLIISTLPTARGKLNKEVTSSLLQYYASINTFAKNWFNKIESANK